MDVAISELRANLSDWLGRAREGDEVVVTDRGVPVARILGIDATPTIERLTREGVIGRPRTTHRPVETDTTRPRARRSMSDLVSEQRD
jgi:prevent-host-death family protein